MDGVYSCGYNVFLGWIHQTPAATNTPSSREGTTGIRPEGKKANPKSPTSTALHELLQAYKAMLLAQRETWWVATTHLWTHSPSPASSSTAGLHSSFPDGDRGLFCRPSLGLWRVGAQSHRLWGSKVIRQAHSGNNYSFLSPENKALKYCITFLPANPMIFIFCYTMYTLSTWIISAKQCYKMKRQMIVWSNSIKL